MKWRFRRAACATINRVAVRNSSASSRSGWGAVLLRQSKLCLVLLEWWQCCVCRTPRVGFRLAYWMTELVTEQRWRFSFPARVVTKVVRVPMCVQPILRDVSASIAVGQFARSQTRRQTIRQRQAVGAIAGEQAGDQPARHR